MQDDAGWRRNELQGPYPSEVMRTVFHTAEVLEMTQRGNSTWRTIYSRKHFKTAESLFVEARPTPFLIPALKSGVWHSLVPPRASVLVPLYFKLEDYVPQDVCMAQVGMGTRQQQLSFWSWISVAEAKLRACASRTGSSLLPSSSLWDGASTWEQHHLGTWH